MLAAYWQYVASTVVKCSEALLSITFWCAECWLPNYLVLALLLCRSLGGVHGIPKVHYKGRQGDYYIMVGDQLDRTGLIDADSMPCRCVAASPSQAPYTLCVAGLGCAVNRMPRAICLCVCYAGHGYAGAQLVGCVEQPGAGYDAGDGGMHCCGGAVHPQGPTQQGVSSRASRGTG